MCRRRWCTWRGVSTLLTRSSLTRRQSSRISRSLISLPWVRLRTRTVSCAASMTGTIRIISPLFPFLQSLFSTTISPADRWSLTSFGAKDDGHHHELFTGKICLREGHRDAKCARGKTPCGWVVVERDKICMDYMYTFICMYDRAEPGGFQGQGIL